MIQPDYPTLSIARQWRAASSPPWLLISLALRHLEIRCQHFEMATRMPHPINDQRVSTVSLRNIFQPSAAGVIGLNAISANQQVPRTAAAIASETKKDSAERPR